MLLRYPGHGNFSHFYCDTFNSMRLKQGILLSCISFCVFILFSFHHRRIIYYILLYVYNYTNLNIRQRHCDCRASKFIDFQPFYRGPFVFRVIELQNILYDLKPKTCTMLKSFSISIFLILNTHSIICNTIK